MVRIRIFVTTFVRNLQNWALNKGLTAGTYAGQSVDSISVLSPASPLFKVNIPERTLEHLNYLSRAFKSSESDSLSFWVTNKDSSHSTVVDCFNVNIAAYL